MLSDEFINQSHGPGSLRSEVACTEHQLHGIGGAGLLHTAGAAAKTRVDTEFDFGKAESCMVQVAGNAVIECQ